MLICELPSLQITAIQERSQNLLLNEVVISSKKDYSGEKDKDELELPLFDFGTIATATENFSDENMLGKGGFGCVHKVNSCNNTCNDRICMEMSSSLMQTKFAYRVGL